MTFLTELWLPILLSAVFVFIVSSVIHMATPMHKHDFGKLPNEDAVLESLRARGIEPGTYVFPCCESMKEMNSPEMIERRKRGPVGWMTILPPGEGKLGKSLVGWFLYTLVVGTFAAYLGWHALGAGAPYLSVFRIVGTAVFMAYALDHVSESIWKDLRWGTTARFFVDGTLYALVTAGTFGWLWPDAAA